MPSLPALLGRAGGKLLAPFAAAIAALRHARVFHPRGVVYRAEIRPYPGSDARLSARLTGPALVRLSSAWWKRKEWPDVLGIAIRLRSTTLVSSAPDPGDQDLLFATVKKPWLLPVAPLLTNHHDYLGNDYYAVSPFADDDLGHVRWRLTSPGDAGLGSREERLAAAVEEKRAIFQLQVAETDEELYHPVAEIILVEQVHVDQERLRFSPFRDGHGMHPRGLVHNLRPAAYLASRTH